MRGVKYYNMSKIPYKYIGVSKIYKHVYLYQHGNNIIWQCHVLKFSKFYDTEKEANDARLLKLKELNLNYMREDYE